VTQLIAGFFGVVGDLAGGTPLAGADALPACPIQACEVGTASFTVDAGVVSISLLALRSSSAIEIELRSPEAPAAVVAITGQDPGASQGDAALGSATVHWTKAAQNGVLVDITFPSEQGPWDGAWSMTFVDRAGTVPAGTGTVRLYAFGDLRPVIDPAPFRAGEANVISVSLQHRDGRAVNEAIFAGVQVDAVVVDPRTNTREPVVLGAPDGGGVRTGSWPAPETDFPATVTVEVTARPTTASGLALAPVMESVAIAVLPPGAYPSLQPTRLLLDAITGDDSGTAIITVRGGATAGGCVWFEGSQVSQAPEDAGEMVVDVEPRAVDRGTCLHVGAGQQAQLTVSIRPSASASGRAAGSLTIVLLSDADATELRTSVGWEVPLHRPLDTDRRLLIAAVLTAIGILVPLAFMWVLNFVMATFEPLSGVMVARVPAVVTTSDRVYRKGRAIVDGLCVAPEEFAPLRGNGRTRRFSVQGLQFRSRVPRLPFAAASGQVSTAAGVVGSLPPATVGRRTDSAPVPFGLAGAAVVVLSDESIGRAPVALDATIAMALGERREEASEAGTGFDSSFGRRPDLEADLIVFAPASELDQYTSHFDRHRDAVAAVVDSLYEKRRRERRARRNGGG
jgi:hypothetical protein